MEEEIRTLRPDGKHGVNISKTRYGLRHPAARPEQLRVARSEQRAQTVSG